MLRGEPQAPTSGLDSGDNSGGIGKLNDEGAFGTPIPGLMLEMHVAPAGEPTVTYEVITDRDGHLTEDIQVVSSSDVVVTAKDSSIAKLAVSGPAMEFAKARGVKVVANPRVEPLEICRDRVDGEELLRFKYRNYNPELTKTLIPVTTLSRPLYRDPDLFDDDLELNDIRGSSKDSVLLPREDILRSESEDVTQSFDSGDGSFTVSYDLSKEPLEWSLLGKIVRADINTALCQSKTTLSCSRIANNVVEGIYLEFNKSVSDTVKQVSRVKVGASSARIRISPDALRRVRRIALSMIGVSSCELSVASRLLCKPAVFPRAELLALYRNAFRQPMIVDRQVFNRFHRSGQRSYAKFLDSAFSGRVFRCS